jgi:hypothetical protein
VSRRLAVFVNLPSLPLPSPYTGAMSETVIAPYQPSNARPSITPNQMESSPLIYSLTCNDLAPHTKATSQHISASNQRRRRSLSRSRSMSSLVLSRDSVQLVCMSTVKRPQGRRSLSSMLRTVFIASAVQSRHLINLLNGLCLRVEEGQPTLSCNPTLAGSRLFCVL